MLSLSELSRAARILDRDLAGSRIERWAQPDGQRLGLCLYVPESEPDRDSSGGGARRRHLLLCAAEEVARVSELPEALRALGKVQLTRHAGGRLDAVPVVDSVRDVRGRLHLGDQHARAQCVNRAAGQVVTIARLDGDAFEQLGAGAARDRCAEVFAIHESFRPLDRNE